MFLHVVPTSAQNMCCSYTLSITVHQPGGDDHSRELVHILEQLVHARLLDRVAVQALGLLLGFHDGALTRGRLKLATSTITYTLCSNHDILNNKIHELISADVCVCLCDSLCECVCVRASVAWHFVVIFLSAACAIFVGSTCFLGRCGGCGVASSTIAARFGAGRLRTVPAKGVYVAASSMPC